MKPSLPVKLTLLAIAWPIFVEQSLRILIGTVDTFMVSHVSDGAVAALGVSNRLIVVALICFNFIGVGTSVVITGTGFTGATAVQFGGTAAASYVVNSATQITAVTAAGSGAVTASVTTTGGTGTSAGTFTFLPAPTAPY